MTGQIDAVVMKRIRLYHAYTCYKVQLHDLDSQQAAEADILFVSLMADIG
jgi:hypothetical protein